MFWRGRCGITFKVCQTPTPPPKRGHTRHLGMTSSPHHMKVTPLPVSDPHQSLNDRDSLLRDLTCLRFSKGSDVLQAGEGSLLWPEARVTLCDQRKIPAQIPVFWNPMVKRCSGIFLWSLRLHSLLPCSVCCRANSTVCCRAKATKLNDREGKVAGVSWLDTFITLENGFSSLQHIRLWSNL
jgi:hypothetical protein